MMKFMVKNLVIFINGDIIIKEYYFKCNSFLNIQSLFLKGLLL